MKKGVTLMIKTVFATATILALLSLPASPQAYLPSQGQIGWAYYILVF
jgi:hypothetical protein